MAEDVRCRQCGTFLFSKSQAGEMLAEIWSSGASTEGRSSDANNLSLCDNCLSDNAYRVVEARWEGGHEDDF